MRYRYDVTIRDEVDAESSDEAAREFARLLMTTRPKEIAVTRGQFGTVFVRVEADGTSKRIA
jgi:hypothetical protein